MNGMASPITGVSIVYPTVCSDVYQTKHQSFASLAFVREIHRLPVNSPHKRPVTRKVFPFDDVIMLSSVAGIWFYYTHAQIPLLSNRSWPQINRIWWLCRSPLVEAIQTISSSKWPIRSGITDPFKWTGNHTYLGLKNNWGMQSKNGLQHVWGNILFFIHC